VIFTASVWAIRRVSLCGLLGIAASQFKRGVKTMQWQSLALSPELYGPYTEVFRRMPSIVARSFQFTPAETLQSSTFTFIPTIERQNQSDAQLSDHEQISMHSLDSEQNLEPVTRTTSISTP
jgi:hypothetical protein